MCIDDCRVFYRFVCPDYCRENRQTETECRGNLAPKRYKSDYINYKMSNGRSFAFHILKSSKADWSAIELMKQKEDCEYLCACSDNKQIMGYVRFTYCRILSTIENYFNKRAIVAIEKKNDEQYRDMYVNLPNFTEHVKKQKEPESGASDNKESLLKFLIQNQTMLANNQSEMANQMVSSQSEMVGQITSEITKQIASICEAIAKNNPLISGDTVSHSGNTHNTTNNTTNHTTNNNTTNNNKFNLKFFLNEQCKDAMDITEFAKTIPIGLDEVMLFKRLGHTEAVTRIIENAYNDMEITKRPMHCTDPKRETFYVKNEEKWTNDETKAITEKAISTVASRSFRQLSLWKTANPGHEEDGEKMTEYAVLVKQLLGGITDKQIEEYNKTIIRNLSRVTHLKRNTVGL